MPIEVTVALVVVLLVGSTWLLFKLAEKLQVRS
jgi:hypothetical protein